MGLDKEKLRRLIEERREANRFTQDSPAMPDVWLALAETERVEVLLTPADGVDPAKLARTVRKRLGPGGGVAYSGFYVVATVGLDQLVRALLPLSEWWLRLWKAVERKQAALPPVADSNRSGKPSRPGEPANEIAWLATVLGAVQTLRARESGGARAAEGESTADLFGAGRKLLQPKKDLKPTPEALLERVTVNRPAEPAVARSRKTVKADAVTRLFDVDCSNVSWAIVDTGIDATHPAFRLRTKEDPEKHYREAFEGKRDRTRVVATYDMTRLRLAHRVVEAQESGQSDPAVAEIVKQYGPELEAIGDHLLDEHPLDWVRLEPLLRVPHTATPDRRGRKYQPPATDHGTHVAGILAADWPGAEDGGADYELTGICPDLRLYDIRVFPVGEPGDEFTISAALQFIDFLNGYGRKIAIAGANLSLSVPYNLSAFGCGQTPVCREANRLVAGGVVVVAAAGNRGREQYVLDKKLIEGFRTVSITDPGNAEDVITVGSTHATDPHAYGVSHFSSRGPTADGRRKPDLVAPGEKIQAPAVGKRAIVEDGTSQAAPHVSGAAALLLARHRELIGRPRRVKQLLMDSAVDLEREHYFQGAGLVDALRAAQDN
ncbi:MAG TPA: S8 family serine peptidase [Solirubrobacterales bacterium]